MTICPHWSSMAESHLAHVDLELLVVGSGWSNVSFKGIVLPRPAATRQGNPVRGTGNHYISTCSHSNLCSINSSSIFPETLSLRVIKALVGFTLRSSIPASVSLLVVTLKSA